MTIALKHCKHVLVCVTLFSSVLLSLPHIVTAGYFQCGDWQTFDDDCKKRHGPAWGYHCQNQDNAHAIDGCGITKTCGAGQRSEITQGATDRLVNIECVNCSEDSYVPNARPSNRPRTSEKCTLKIKCQSTGLYTYDPGDLAHDAQCKCDETAGYLMEIIHNKEFTCSYNDGMCSCYPKSCKTGEVLSESAQRCVADPQDIFRTAEPVATAEEKTVLARTTILDVLLSTSTTPPPDPGSGALGLHIFIAICCIFAVALALAGLCYYIYKKSTCERVWANLLAKLKVQRGLSQGTDNAEEQGQVDSSHPDGYLPVSTTDGTNMAEGCLKMEYCSEGDDGGVKAIPYDGPIRGDPGGRSVTPGQDPRQHGVPPLEETNPGHSRTEQVLQGTPPYGHRVGSNTPDRRDDSRSSSPSSIGRLNPPVDTPMAIVIIRDSIVQLGNSNSATVQSPVSNPEDTNGPCDQEERDLETDAGSIAECTCRTDTELTSAKELF